MKPDKPESQRTTIVVVISTLTFVLFLYLVPYIARLNIPFSYHAILIIRLTGIMSLLCGLGLLFWLIKVEQKSQSTRPHIILHVLSLLLIEYWYFGTRFLSLITN